MLPSALSHIPLGIKGGIKRSQIEVSIEREDESNTLLSKSVDVVAPSIAGMLGNLAYSQDIAYMQSINEKNSSRFL